MPALSPAPLLALVLLSGPVLAAPCLTGVAHVELSAAPARQAPRVCISPGAVTVLSFDAALAPSSVTLEGGERFTQVDEGRSVLKLVPSESVRPGEVLSLTVRFADGAAPTSSVFTLVTQAEQAASLVLVEVHRQPRPVEPCQQQLRVMERESRELREEIARLRTERRAPGGLAGLLASGLLGEEGVPSAPLTFTVTPAPGNSVEVAKVMAYRAQGQVAVAMRLVNSEDAAWVVEGAALTLEGRRGQALKVLTVWQEAPAVRGARPLLVVEAQAPADGARGPYTLTLWGAGGARRVTLRGVMLP